MNRLVLPGLGAALLLLIILEALCRPAGAPEIGWEGLQPFVWLNMAGAAIYFAAVKTVHMQKPRPRTLAIVLTLAAAMRILPLAGPPMLSSDVYRYIWDGRVQAQGINPYRYLPAAPELAFLRDTVIYPYINRSEEAPTIYPPAAQLIFAAVSQVWSSVFGMKLAMAGFETLATACVIALLGRAGLPRSRVLIYAWNPLVVWEFAGNGHIDAASIGLIALAWLLASRRGWAGAVLGLAILCKFLPAAIYPAFWRRWDWRMLAATAAVIIGLYSLYIGAGWHVAGYLPGYAQEEGLSTGSGFFLLRLAETAVTLPAGAERVYIALALLILAALAIRFALGPRHTDATRIAGIGHAAAVLATATMVLISPHYPWYLGWLALFACVAPHRSVIYLSATGTLLYLDPYHTLIVFPLLVYGPCLALAVLDTIQSRNRRPTATGER